ncbi:tetratricopeptide repeat protein [Adhaeribacter radiodurans]|uniref:Tetratricopeptide repeat protein n=1 Tax=Adhaeribacter radiodurans TaxID=2745197 RepID=A0A7L7LDA9_9BACT|nr:tetratricopeptide repeat protein [Adhaeribacter radiodurans]QMU30515.1 tetratricopeptide repeat protein [Adhaeribacter radiodurans]
MTSKEKIQRIDAYLQGNLSAEQEAQVEQWMDDYLSGTLSLEDQAWFNQKLQQDTAFAQEVNLQRDIRLGLEKAMNQEFQQTSLYKDLLASTTTEIDQNLKNRFVLLEEQLAAKEEKVIPLQSKPVNRSLYYWLSGVAACLILGFFVYLFWQNQHKPEQLYAKYYEPYMIASVQRNGSAQNTQQQAMQAYEEGDYQLAAKAFESCLSLTPQDIDCRFYLGLSYLETQQLPKAEQTLKQVIQATPNEYTTRAQWYLALVYLINNKSKDARLLLQELSRDHGFYGKKADMLMEEM